MAKFKSMGTEYQINVEGNWSQIAEAIRATKKLIENTKQRSYRGPISLFSLFNTNDASLENKILNGYLVPKEGETFADYQGRFIQAFAGVGFKGKLFKLSLGKKVPFTFRLTRNDGESTLALTYIAKEGTYDVTIDASGDYSTRGKSIAEGIKANMEQNKMQFKYNSLEKLI